MAPVSSRPWPATRRRSTACDRDADLLLLTREALEIGLAPRFHAPERIREWTYDLDPAGMELLRLAIERVRAARPDEA